MNLELFKEISIYLGGGIIAGAIVTLVAIMTIVTSMIVGSALRLAIRIILRRRGRNAFRAMAFIGAVLAIAEVGTVAMFVAMSLPYNPPSRAIPLAAAMLIVGYVDYKLFIEDKSERHIY